MNIINPIGAQKISRCRMLSFTDYVDSSPRLRYTKKITYQEMGQNTPQFLRLPAESRIFKLRPQEIRGRGSGVGKHNSRTFHSLCYNLQAGPLRHRIEREPLSNIEDQTSNIKNMDEKFANPWRTLSSRSIYQNPWITVREDQVIRPDGQPGIYGVVHMNQKAIGVVPIDDEDHVYLVGQYRYTMEQYSWEIPEGGCPDGETPLQAAQRELLEEAGLEAAQWEEIGIAHLSNSVTDEEATLFLATDLIQREAQPEGTEKIEVLRVPFAEALRMAREGEITDSLSLIGIFQVAMRRGMRDK